MRVRLTDEAVSRLRSIRACIAEDSPRRADEIIDTITRRAARIGAVISFVAESSPANGPSQPGGTTRLAT